MASLVWTSDEDPGLVVARAVAEIAWSDGGEELAARHIQQTCAEAEQLLAAGRTAALVSLLVASADVVLAKAPEKDAECIFSVICNYVAKAPSGAEEEAMVGEILGKLLPRPPVEKAALRLKLLFVLYNAVKAPFGRFQVYLRGLEFAAAARAADAFVPSFRRLDAFVREWGAGPRELRPLYLAVTNVLRETKGSAKDSFAYLMKYLATFSREEPDGVLAGEQEHAVRAAAEFMRSPDMFQMHRFTDTSIYIPDLLEMPAVRRLERDPQQRPVYELLRVFLTGQLSDYLAFHADRADVVEGLGIVHSEAVAKMRLMSLVSLAADGGPSNEIRYSAIQQALKLDADDVETWVVRAIGAKLLEARMDQMRQVVIITRCPQRTFGRPQWEELRRRLSAWKENVARVSRIVHNARASGGIPQVAAAY